MKTYIEKLSVRKIMKGWYQVQGHHRNHTITIVKDDDICWYTEGKAYSSFKDAKALLRTASNFFSGKKSSTRDCTGCTFFKPS